MAFLVGAYLAIEELEEEEMRLRGRITRRMLRDTQNPFSIPDREFIQTFRLTKDVCTYVINKVEPNMNLGRYANKIPIHLRVLCAIYFLAAGSYQRNIGNNLWACLSQSVVSLSLTEFCLAINRRCFKQWVRFPRNNEEKRTYKQRFFQRHRMRDVIGIVDGTQVAIIKPRLPVLERPYVNRKSYHSMNVQIVCDADSNILHVQANRPGSMHDSFVWRHSSVGRTMRANYEFGDHNSIIIGDSGYPSLPWLMVPVLRPHTYQEIRYNNTFKRARSTVERTIGILKGRFRCLLKERTLHYTPRKAARIIVACTILHNIARRYRVEDPEPLYDDIDLDPPAPPPPHVEDIVYRQRGQEFRANYIQTYF